MPSPTAAAAGSASEGRLPELLEAVRRAAAGGPACEAALTELLATLCEGCDRDGAIDAVLSSGALPTVMGLLRAGVPARTQELAARAVAQLSRLRYGRANYAIIQAGALPPLLALLRGGAPQSPEEQAAAAAIRSLAANPCHPPVKALLAAGAVPTLVALLQGRRGHETLRHAVEILSDIACKGDEALGAVLEAGAAPAIVALVERVEQHPDALRHAVLASVQALAERGLVGRSAMLQAGAMPALVACLRKPMTHGYVVGTVDAIAVMLDPADADHRALLMATVLPLLMDKLATWPESPGADSSGYDLTPLMHLMLHLLSKAGAAVGAITCALVALMRSPSVLGRDLLLGCVGKAGLSLSPKARNAFVKHLLVHGAAAELWSSAAARKGDQKIAEGAMAALASSISNRGRFFRTSHDDDDDEEEEEEEEEAEEEGVKAGLAALVCAMLSTPGTLNAHGRLHAMELLCMEEYALHVASLMVEDSERGGSMRRNIARFSSAIRCGAGWGEGEGEADGDCTSDRACGRAAKRLRALPEDFDRDIPGSLCFLVAGRRFFGSAHLMRRASHTLRQAMDALAGGGAARGTSQRPLPVVGPASIPEDCLHALFLACMKHAHCDLSVAELGEAPAALWECARWLQMEELMAECGVEAGRQLRACGSGEEAARTLEESLFGMLRGSCQGAELVGACGAAMVRWADVAAMGELLVRPKDADLAVACTRGLVDAVAALAAEGCGASGLF
eukprot:jgi/Tetstr1/423525/TSEL_014198.t1